jgi:hypothetical protein
MITQTFKQGKHEIKIESAESLEDAEKNNFPSGIYTKCYVDGKLVENYMAMIRFIVDEAKKNKQTLIPSGPDLIKQREKMFENQKKEVYDHLDKLKKQYGEMGLPEKAFEKIEDFMEKIDPSGVRIKE